ncbi:hypothetical protein NM688_g2389 [Phlebia brevispora]|uniref:Uncharacterized protein n=1 Tax=Phlebia brevispora TaxID=194682 RepID=A0ACC1T900_9APHY|nr:hypothetical protein NM688_g2389 [Phlebia brevispora]
MTSHVGILPQDVLDTLLAQLSATEEQRGLRFLRLPHPRTGIPSLYLPYQTSQTNKSCIAEVQTIDPPNKRSWFMSDNAILENGNLLVMTPIDPAFLLIPVLQATTDGSAGTFRPMDDVFEDAIEKLAGSLSAPTNPKDASTELSSEDLRRFFSLDCARDSMKRVCDVKGKHDHVFDILQRLTIAADITPEITVYRYSQERVIETVKVKVTRLVVPEVLESSKTLIRNLAKDGLMEDGKENLLSTGQLRAACDLVSQYLPPSVYNDLLASYDFTALTAYLKLLSDEADEVAASQIEKAETKKSKAAAASETNDKKRKNAKASHGVEQLKKANTKGMAKLSTFFQPKKAA